MINKLLENCPEILYKLSSYTTRPIREKEKEGIDYYFITKEQFIQMEQQGKLFGVKKYNNNYYGSNIYILDEGLKNWKIIIILNYNIETVNELKDKLEFNCIAILPPSKSELRERLIKRKTKPEEI